jgi:hypothetical protein
MMSTRPKLQGEHSEPAPLGFIIVIFVTGILLAVLFALLSTAFLIAMPVVVPLGATVIIAALVWVYFWPRS